MGNNEVLEKYKVAKKVSLLRKKPRSSKKKRFINLTNGISAIIDKENRDNDKLIVVTKNKIVKEVNVVIFDEMEMEFLYKYI